MVSDLSSEEPLSPQVPKQPQVAQSEPVPFNDRMDEFVALYTRHQRRLHIYLISLLPNRDDADDVMQETGLVLWREFSKFERGTNFAAWSSQVAFHQVLAWRKRRDRSRIVFSEEFLSAIAAEIAVQEDELSERTAALAECLTRLPQHHQELIKLRYSAGNGIEEISRSLNRSIEAVYRMLSRVRMVLEECVSRRVIDRGIV